MKHMSTTVYLSSTLVRLCSHTGIPNKQQVAWGVSNNIYFKA